jgi:outer membrane protein insertion porin family
VRAFEVFRVGDIRIEGVQRTDPGTVFNYLPVRIGDEISTELASAAIRALFATGFYRDVRLERDGEVLVVYIEERPAIGAVTFDGIKEFDKEVIRKALADTGLAEGRIFDRSVLDRAEQEIKRQYLSRGKYAVRLVATVTPLERNRVSVNLNVSEGENARIEQIAFLGNSAFSERVLLDQIKLQRPGWLTWFTKNDQYSREKLQADLESLRSFYTERGYLEFQVDSTQVSITPDREDVYITVALKEGDQFRIARTDFGGNLLGREDRFRAALRFRAGEVFNGRILSESMKRISDELASLGYAFANVNPVPEFDRDRKEVSFIILVDPGRRVYVRRINVSGNARTKDEVVRREMRQFESSWYDADRIRLSRERIQRTGFFKQVQIDTVPVADSPDQVDLAVVVEELPTGNLNVGAGFSSTERIVFSAGINESNFFGTGQSLAFSINTSRLNQTIAISWSNPYWTRDGVGRSVDLFSRRFDAAFLGLGDYSLRNTGAGVRFFLPYTELTRLGAGLAFEQTKLDLGANPPRRFADYVAQFGAEPRAVVNTLTWSRDSRDSAFQPREGAFMVAALDTALPGLDLKYLRLTHLQNWYFPISRQLTLGLTADLGYGQAYGGQTYPIFKNFYAGGIGSVRGYFPSSLGERDTDGVSIGGRAKTVFNAELGFPIPGTKDLGLRAFAFTDAGNVFPTDRIDPANLRFSAGLGVAWLSPFGPLKLSFGVPISPEPTDRIQRIQFQVGTGL